ncbi:cytochrome-c peroxidase [Tenacibaculum sp. IB213877]|uniref:cytochrome-c peroxidase n=1 Tax=Tenacibaculum sp. IB213877 TaxID=3097351 RepID=UPI002A5A2682|nr:cytochrome c peroxidase [Tenacibaculum sp. IB213877]MDY0781537.1 cytochrome c peroxidase [Tenacibaculum sp. IB213877]
MIIKSTHIYLVLFLAIFLNSCKKNQDKKEVTPVVNFEIVQNFYLEHINESLVYIDSLAMFPSESTEAKTLFTKLRNAFKKAEPYASYLNPEVGHRANGPALPVLTDDTQRVLHPIGLQKIEESIYEGDVSNSVYQEEIRLTKGLLSVLKKNIENRKLTPQRFFVATHQQLFRIISLGISGFDTPVSQLGIKESAISLESLQFVYENSIQSTIKSKDEKLDTEFRDNISKAVNFIKQNDDFNTFDRYTFIRDYMNPITKNWVAIRKESDIWEPIQTTPFNFDAPTFFEENSFNVNFFTQPNNRNPSEKQIELGKKLFFDPQLSSGGKMACATCHIPEKGYADGLTVSLDNSGKGLQRNTPTLINTALQQSFFWDGRSATLLDQISSVFLNPQEFDTNVHQFSNEILKDTTYYKLFQDAFGCVSTKNTDVIKAISSYVSTLNGFNSKFDKNIRGEEATFTEEEKLGLNLFMGKALCATCHFMPLTNGTVPPFFKETEKEVIGVPETSANKQLDDDLGFYWKYKSELHYGMFKTPTVRNAELTSPYMHNGVYKTLEEVIDFYNKGGGAGLGFDLPHQTLPFDNLELTEKEQKALIAYIKTLNDVPVETY